MTTISRVGPDQYDDVRRVVADATREDGRSPLNEATLLSLQHQGPAGRSLWVARDDQGSLTGFALASHPADTDHERGDARGPVAVNLVVAPSARRARVGRRLADAALDALGHARVSAWSHGNHPGAAALAADLGFERIRELWVMRRSLAQDLPEVTAPEGIVVRAFRPGRDEEAFLALNAEAFVDHPEQGQMTRPDLEARMAEPWFDPAGFFLAERADAPPAEADQGVESPSLLGFHWTKVHDEDPPHGEVYVVGVSPAAQGLGLGKLLTLTGLRHLRDLGLAEVILYVEADNAPAVAVYSGLGFTHAAEDTDVMYARG